MILRRVIAHFRKQEWTAIFLDFVIVVAGILLAFQITDWSERRAESARETRYLAEIVNDLRSDAEECDFIRRNAERRMSAAEAILTKSGAPPRRVLAEGALRIDDVAPFRSDDPYAVNAALSGVPTLDGSRQTYEALISTGDFRLLRDPAIARAIQDYYANVDEVISLEADLEDFRRAVSTTRHRLGVSNIAAITLDELATLVASDHQFRAEIETYWVFSAVQRREIAGLRDQASALIERIEKSQ